MRHSYKNKDDVILLLTDVTGKVEPVSMKERAERAAKGEFVRSIIIDEYEVSQEYKDIVHKHMDSYIEDMAKYVGILAEQLYQVKGKRLVLVDIVRAGIPIGILVKRYLKEFYDIDVYHYGISLVKGLDRNAMHYIINKHGTEGIQFIDGWTGKGTVAKEVRNSAKDYIGVDDSLAVLSDCIKQAKYAGTREDVYIPHSPLNAAVTGLVSITVKNEVLTGPDGFHAALYLKDLGKDDESQSFVDKVCAKFTKQKPCEMDSQNQVDDCEIDKIAEELKRDKKLLNPGINEAARAVLRRELEKLIVYDKTDRDLIPLMELAKSKGVRVEEMPTLKGYKAVSVANDNYVR